MLSSSHLCPQPSWRISLPTLFYQMSGNLSRIWFSPSSSLFLSWLLTGFCVTSSRGSWYRSIDGRNLGSFWPSEWDQGLNMAPNWPPKVLEEAVEDAGIDDEY